MLVHLVIILMLTIIALVLYSRKADSTTIVYNDKFKQLQKSYCVAFCLARFSDWLHGPYDYKLYSDYGYDENAIAMFFVISFMSSSLFGTVVGHFGDKYGRKYLCVSYGVIYSICALCKASANLNLLILGGITGGMSNAIQYSTFESWYVNEHLSYQRFPTEWMHLTFSKVSFYNGLLAIVAGLVAEYFSEVLNYGPVSPYLLSIPFLLLSTCFIYTNWTEHPSEEAHNKNSNEIIMCSSLKFIFCDDSILLLLGLVEMFFECTTYMFIFSWSPILSEIHPPLGLVFSFFMIAFMTGAKLYEILINRRYKPENILMFTCISGFICLSAVTIMLSPSSVVKITDTNLRIYICGFCFFLYELSIGLYHPLISYLRGRIIPERYRSSVANWYRFPMSIISCVTLLLGNKSHNGDGLMSHNSKFLIIFHVCSILLLLNTWVSVFFGKMYAGKMEDERLRIDNEQKKVATTTDNLSNYKIKS